LCVENLIRNSNRGVMTRPADGKSRGGANNRNQDMRARKTGLRTSKLEIGCGNSSRPKRTGGEKRIRDLKEGSG